MQAPENLASAFEVSAMSAGYDYVREGAEIYRRSFAMIRAEADLARFQPAPRSASSCA